MADVIAGDVEGEHGDGGAVVLGNQAGLAVDSAFEDGQGWSAGGEVGQVAGGLLGALDRVQGGSGQAAASATPRTVLLRMTTQWSEAGAHLF